jgi:hypothetical protein
MPSIRIRPSILASAAFCLVTAACTATHASRLRPTPVGVHEITADQIRGLGASNAWEVVERHSGSLLIRHNSRTGQARITHRGVSSLLIRSDVLVVVDGTHLFDWSYLQDIPAETVASIQVLSAREGTIRYGTPAGNGVIVVSTRVPGRSD